MAKNLNPCSCSMDLTEHQCWESWNPSDTRSHGRKTLWRSISSPVCLMGVTIPWDSGCTSSTTVPIPCRGSRRWLWLSLMPCHVMSRYIIGDGANVGEQEGAAAVPRGARPGGHIRGQLETGPVHPLENRHWSLHDRLLQPLGGGR